jgi:hypothetical protein
MTQQQMKQLTFQISEDAFNLLKKIGDQGAAEYRDTEYQTLYDFKNSDEYKTEKRTEEWFLNRNYGGTLHLIYELYNYGLVGPDFDSWHLTYILTPFGKEMIKQ